MTAIARATRRAHERLEIVLATLGIEAADAAPVTGAAPWSAAPRTFKVVTPADGTIKVRMMRHQHRAARVERLTAALADPRVPALLARVGATTVERWVDGTPLGTGAPVLAHVHAGADILAAVHGFPGLAGERLPREQRLGSFRAQAEPRLAELAAARVISRAEARASRLLLAALPVTAAWGLTHTDFGGDNLVMANDGVLVSIDNEHLVRGFLEYDLARTWYRWRMPPSAWRQFERQYRASTGREVPADEQRAWRVVAASVAVHRRHRVAAPIDVALRALREALD